MKPLTRKINRRMIIIYYALALIFVAIGVYKSKPSYYLVAVLLFCLALLRKYWLDKKLVE